MVTPLRIGLVAGEASGDLLGAALIDALRAKLPAVEFIGLAGERMRAAGCEALGSSQELAVMGLVEPLRHLPRLLRLRSRLLRTFIDRHVDVFVGIDSPAFNLGLARRLRRRGLITAQYVSPQVWAWRKGRVRSIAAAVDAVLCLLPFEPDAYRGHPVRAEFVGHPLADQIPLQVDRAAARRTLDIPAAGHVVAVLPGSRMGEVGRLGADFAAATVQLGRVLAGPLHFVAPMASAQVAAVFRRQVQAAGADIQLVEQQADLVLAAADVALVASGTATLQAMLHGCPMVVAYRLAPLTAFIARDLGLVKVTHFSLPNLLAGEPLVPEFFQQAATPVALASALREALVDEPRTGHLQRRFHALHLQLRQGGAARAAEVVMDLLDARGETFRMSMLVCIAGVDEAGRGPLAGPVYAAAVILDPRRPIKGLRDSKLLTPARRDVLAVEIRERAMAWQIAWADVEEIDCLNILGATMLAMRRAVAGLAVRPSVVQVDGNRTPQIADYCERVETVVGGDAIVAAISAASILAKQARDALMPELERAYPGYQLGTHKGYSTPDHLAALTRLGPSPQHRRSFAPVRDAFNVLET